MPSCQGLKPAVADPPDARREVAKETFRAMALAEPHEVVETWDLRERSILGAASEALEMLAGLKGTYYLNGLASCQVGDRLVHPFEAHGFIRSIEFHGDGKATYRGKFVETPCTSFERAAGRPLFKGVMSNVAEFRFPAALLNAISPGVRDTANLACRAWPPVGTSGVDPVLIASGDNQLPVALCPEELVSQGALGFDGLAGQKWLAHTRYDVSRERLVFASCTYEGDLERGLATRLEFREYDVFGNLVAESSHNTSFMVMHDWMVTDSYYVVPKNPARLEPTGLAKFLAGLAQGTSVFTMAEDQCSSFLLIPRAHTAGDVGVKEVAADRFFNVFHLGPTYELQDENQLVIHGLVFDSYAFGGEMGFDIDRQDFDPIGWSARPSNPPPRLHRFVIDVTQGTMLTREQLPLKDCQAGGIDVPVDMPTFHPLRDGLPARFCYFSGAARPEGWFPFRSIVKADLRNGSAENWDAGDESIVSEPLLVPRGRGAVDWLGEESEDDGWVFSVVHNAREGRCELVVFDARSLGEGPKVAIDMGELSPWGVHSCWVPTTRA